MALTTQQRIRLQELLLQREALYARVSQIEARIHHIFGAEYPLPPPPVDVAPSGAQATKSKKPAPKAKLASPQLRALEPGETAYRVRFTEESGAADEIHQDKRSLAGFLDTPVGRQMIESIETLDAEGKPCERLWSSPQWAKEIKGKRLRGCVAWGRNLPA